MLDENYKIVLVGLDDEQKQKLPASILGITRTNNTKELAEIYTAADVCVNPTYCDTYPTVNLEAQACETPVVTYRTGGSVESVPPEQVVEQGDLKALENMIYSVCGKDFKIKKCEEFEKKVLFNQYLKLYNEIYNG